MEALLVLPNPNELSPIVLIYLNQHFNTHQDLSTKPSSLSTQLKKNCGDLDKNLTTLHNNLSSLISQWSSRSNSLTNGLNQLQFKFQELGLASFQERIGVILGEELPILVREVRRIETVRVYAETTLRLEALIGDLEDAVFCFMNPSTMKRFSGNLLKTSSLAVGHIKNFEWKQQKLLLAVMSINVIEDVLANISKTRSNWYHLLKTVDGRVDDSLASLRLQAQADYRALLASLGWPPHLLTSELDRERGLEIPNPLVLMQGEEKERYSQAFLALCALQQLQIRREERLVNLVGQKWNSMLGLWTIDELVSLIASKTEPHFLKWFDQPKFIFALVYKITRAFVGGVDDILQPLTDKARLVGFSAKEAWVSAMVKMLSAYLAKRVFCILVEKYTDKKKRLEVTYSWLHLIDLIIAFDKRMQSLASLGFEGYSRKVSVLSIFCDKPDWLRIWAKIELKDGLDKLKGDLLNEGAWLMNDKQETDKEFKFESLIIPIKEDYKAPLIAESVIKITKDMIERCQNLQNIVLRSEFIRSSAIKFLWHFFSDLLKHCNKAEFTNVDGLMRVCGSINIARYIESILREWSEDVNFLEMIMAEIRSNIAHVRSNNLDDKSFFFWEEIKWLRKLETEWVAEIMADFLRKFEMLAWNYVHNKEQWGRKRDHRAVSDELVEALDDLRNGLQFCKTGLNSKDFLDLWRSVADGLDHFIFSAIVMSDTVFSKCGVDQLSTDIQALFLVFQPLCSRPKAFFPCIRDSLMLFGMDFEDVYQLQVVLSEGIKGVEILRSRGILSVSCHQAEKILNSRKFGV
ncbi:hypothetical protein GIB67_024707 [Kingdonia uniflora]|uniref:RINT1-like protein MAG2L n=1 Tax=Kingdonia uniflora TaxID=39325 RepID=A0A7J7NA26_9MAGN|nr:hypothetical protein GIB67_024707 [Kingdonia uniflora]